MKRKKPEGMNKSELTSMLKEERLGISPQEMHSMGKELQMKAQMGVDVEYIRTALFPELNNGDVPQPMSNVSYCRFSDKQEIGFSPGTMEKATNPDGSGVLVWYPKITQGPSMFMYSHPEGKPLDLPVLLTPYVTELVSGSAGTSKESAKQPVNQVYKASQLESLDNTWRVGACSRYAKYFNSAVLVGASINLQFCGALQSEAGYMVGGLLFDQRIDTLTTDSIENSDFKVTAKPGDGIRIIYLPKDEEDYQFNTTNKNLARNAGLSSDNENEFCIAAVKIKVDPSITIPTPLPDYCVNGLTVNQAPFQGYGMIGSTKRWWSDDISFPSYGLNNSSNPCELTVVENGSGPMIAIYWRGLPVAPSCGQTLRAEIVRRYNGVPKPEFREVIDIQKPLRTFDAKKSTDIIYQLQLSVPQVVAHTMRQFDRIQDQISQYIPNIGHLYQAGLFRQQMNLNSFAQKLQLEESGQIGQGNGSGLIWE